MVLSDTGLHQNKALASSFQTKDQQFGTKQGY